MNDERIVEIPINLIKHIDNSRLRLESGEIVSLMEDIKHRGLLQPIGVIQEGETYIIRFGNRRLEACKKLGWKSIPAIIGNSSIDEETFMADNLAENYHRVDLSPVELANQCKKFQEKGYSISEISALLTISKSKIIQALAISNNAPEAFKKVIGYIKMGEQNNKKGKVSISVANEILTFSNYLTSKQKEKLFEVAKKDELSGGQVRLIKNIIRLGKTFEEAMEDYKKYKMCDVELPLKISELEKYKCTAIDLFKGFITGKIEPNKKLID